MELIMKQTPLDHGILEFVILAFESEINQKSYY